MTLHPFYPIVETSQWFELLASKGVKQMQLRIKDQTEEHIRSEIRRTKTLSSQYDCQLIVNDHWQIAIEEECDFIHLGQEDLEGADMDAIHKTGMKLGISTHDDAELTNAISLQPDYIALGPVYPTILKEMKWKPQGLAKITEWKEAVGDIPLVAIGGLTVERAAGAFEAGADAIAVVTDITMNQNPVHRVKEWLDLTRQMRW